MLRTLAYTGAGAARRRMLHRRALDVLDAEGAPVAATDKTLIAC